MEPLFFKAENLIALKTTGEQTASFNGAAFFQSGKYDIEYFRFPAAGNGFNGAAFFQSGKLDTGLAASLLLRASMEPLFFKAENLRNSAFSQRRVTASMEPLFFKAENFK